MPLDGMLEQRLLDSAIREFQLQVEVERNFRLAVIASYKTRKDCEIPWIGGIHDFRKPHLWIRNSVRRALTAQFWCSQTNPEMPSLPLRETKITLAQINADPVIEAWGNFAEFLRDLDWRFSRHFPFEKYCAASRRANPDWIVAE